MKKAIILSLWGLMAVFLLLACTDEDKNNEKEKETPQKIITIKSYSDNVCKKFNTKSTVTPDKTCVVYSYNNGILNMKHINAGFNCDPGNLSATVTLKNDTIIIQEHEVQSGVKCLCLFDLDIELSNVLPQVYTIKFVEPYAPKEQPLTFKVDLNKSPEDAYCVNRKKYPWGK